MLLLNVTFKYFVTCNLEQFEMTATVSVDGGGIRMQGNMKHTSYYYDHGKDVSIEPPPAARN